MDNPAIIVKSKQRAWADRCGIEVDKDGYCLELHSNLYEPLSACSCRDFASGDGSELGKPGTRGKIQALHSSAALACNFFDYWCSRDLAPLAESLHIPTRLCGLAFEQKYPTGLGGISPNLDVVLFGRDGTTIAIESKFIEWLSASKHKRCLQSKYYPEGQGLWTKAGLQGCQKVAEDLRSDQNSFELLDVAQLLKHMLGLARLRNPWKLICLWYSTSGSIADQHAKELARFSQQIAPDNARFEALSYQNLFDRISGACNNAHEGWQSYMRERYFLPAANLVPE